MKASERQPPETARGSPALGGARLSSEASGGLLSLQGQLSTVKLKRVGKKRSSERKRGREKSVFKGLVPESLWITSVSL